MKRRDGTMLRKILLIVSLFFMSAVMLMTPLAAQSDPTDPEEVAQYESRPSKGRGGGD